MVMAKIKVFQRGNIQQDRHFYIEEAAHYFAGKLFSARMSNLISVRIELRASKLPKDTLGCVYSKHKRNQREFKILIRRDEPLRKQLRALAHEMVHVRQMAYNELQHRYFRTQRQTRKFWKGVDHTETPYQDLPWEIETRSMERELAGEWVNKFDPKRKKLGFWAQMDAWRLG